MTPEGYILEASVPFDLLGLAGLRPGMEWNGKLGFPENHGTATG